MRTATRNATPRHAPASSLRAIDSARSARLPNTRARRCHSALRPTPTNSLRDPLDARDLLVAVVGLTVAVRDGDAERQVLIAAVATAITANFLIPAAKSTRTPIRA